MKKIFNKIEDIPPIPDGIREAAENGKLVLFIGAGVSRIIGGPTWEQLAKNFLDYLYKELNIINYYEYYNLIKMNDSRKILTICKNILKKNKKEMPNMRTFLKTDEKLEKKYKIYESIYNFNCIYITTNYDDNLDKVAQKPNLSGLTLKSEFQNDSKNKNNIKNKIFYSENDLLLSKLENGNIFHIHGSVQDDKEIVMTLTDYMEYYKNNSNATILLEEIFASYTVVFVGYGLEEYEILEFMISKYKKEKTVAPRHFMLFPLFKHEENLLKFYENYYLDLGINIVHYFIDKNGYEQLSAILEEWSNIIHEYARTQYFLDRVKLIDEVVK